jgi:hypothetical protein
MIAALVGFVVAAVFGVDADLRRLGRAALHALALRICNNAFSLAPAPGATPKWSPR